MATGATGGVTFLSNLPPDQFQMNPAAFAAATERQDIPQQTQPYLALGTPIQIRVQNVGVLAMVRLNVQGTLVVGGSGAVTLLPGFPYTLLKRCALNANGQTSMIGASAVSLRARRNRIFRNPAETIENSPPVGVIANGSYAISFMVEVPVSHDFLTGTGWILAQNPATSLTLDITTAAAGDIATVASGGTIAFSGNVLATITTFAVGSVPGPNGQTQQLVPDLTVYHGLLDNRLPLTGAGIFQAPVLRVAGQLVNYSFNLNNAGVAEIAPAALTEVDFKYGGNRQPRVYNPVTMLLEKNQEDYNGPIQVKGLTYTFIDFEADNPSRDVFIPEALVELLAQITIPNSITVNTGAFLTYLLENLYPAV